MSSIAVAPAASRARVRTPIKSRALIWRGGPIAIKIPEGAKRGFYSEEGKESVAFLQFVRYVKGGVVNIYLHNPEESVAGRTIKATAELWQKTLQDGRSFFYVNLKQQPSDVDETHRLEILPGKCDDPAAFETPPPLVGYVLFRELTV